MLGHGLHPNADPAASVTPYSVVKRGRRRELLSLAPFARTDVAASSFGVLLFPAERVIFTVMDSPVPSSVHGNRHPGSFSK
jgi:hypothetical protein